MAQFHQVPLSCAAIFIPDSSLFVRGLAALVQLQFQSAKSMSESEFDQQLESGWNLRDNLGVNISEYFGLCFGRFVERAALPAAQTIRHKTRQYKCNKSIRHFGWFVSFISLFLNNIHNEYQK